MFFASLAELSFRAFVNIRQVDDLLNLTATESVNRLLGVTDNHIHIAKREAILHQRQEILPLQHRGILKLIDEIMSVFLAYPLIDERHRAVA